MKKHCWFVCKNKGNAVDSDKTQDIVTYTDAEGKKVTISAETVVSAFGYKAYNPLQKIAEENCSEVYTVGSAVKAGNALTAIREGYQAGFKL